MTASLSILTLALLGQADAFTLHFEGFVSTREMNQQQLTKMFRGAFEAVSDEPESLFAVSDSPNADVLASASQTLDEEGLVFHWSLSTTRCPIRHLEFDQHRPKQALNFDEAKVMVREVAHKAHQLLHGHAGAAGLACLEEGESMGGTATIVSEQGFGDGSGGGEAYPGYSSYGFGFGYGHNPFAPRLPSGTATTGPGPRPSPSASGTPASVNGTASYIIPSHVPAPGGGSHPSSTTGTAAGPKPASATLGNTGASLPHGGGGVGATAGHRR